MARTPSPRSPRHGGTGVRHRLGADTVTVEIGRVADILQGAEDLVATAESMFKLASKKQLGNAILLAQARINRGKAANRTSQERGVLVLEKLVLWADA